MKEMTRVEAMEMAIALATAEGNDALIEKLVKIRDGFTKKSTGEKKPTERQVENLGYRDAIVAFLSTGEKHTVGELLKGVPALAENPDMTNLRVSAIVRGLKDEGILVREEIKRKAYFSLA